MIALLIQGGDLVEEDLIFVRFSHLPHFRSQSVNIDSMSTKCRALCKPGWLNFIWATKSGDCESFKSSCSMKSWHKWGHFKMEPEEPFQSNCLEHLALSTFGMSELGKITFEQGHSNIVFQTTVWTANRKAGILPTRADDYGLSFWRQN